MTFSSARRALMLALFGVGAVLALAGCTPDPQPGREGRWTAELLLAVPGEARGPAPLYCNDRPEMVGSWALTFGPWKDGHNEGSQAPCGKPHGIRYGKNYDGKPILTFMDGDGTASDLWVPLDFDSPDAMEGWVLEPPSPHPRYIAVRFRAIRVGARQGKVLGNEGRGSEP